jgi:RNA polymerase sigma-70 factor (ECF subfamily)
MTELAQALARGRAAHPGLGVTEAAFGRCLARATEGRAGASRDQLPVEDLYLACACAEGVRGAAEAFEARFGKIIRRAVARVAATAAEREEAEQRTRDHLLVRGDDGAPKIAKYRGEGPLANWVSVAAIRLAVSLGRSESAERRLREKAAGEAAGPNPELLVMKGELRREFEVAVESALAQLEERERMVLRLYLVSGMTLTAIGKTFGITQQAVSKTLERARTSVLGDVRRRLGERLKLPKGELASVLRLVGSRLDISISRLLGAA